jgi:hypothetical protein
MEPTGKQLSTASKEGGCGRNRHPRRARTDEMGAPAKETLRRQRGKALLRTDEHRESADGSLQETGCTKSPGNKVAIKSRLLGRRVQESESSRKVPLTGDPCCFPIGLGRVRCESPGHTRPSGGLGASGPEGGTGASRPGGGNGLAAG